ncbi:nucleotidyltransferase [Flavobacterium branchiarum]|nr:nucleotidyltransferase [Flavobacterium branchiarum]MDN3671516.1 nucleotidyltransferase [Flavobacterium branchiarum]MDN3675749.1 nucleotidyltransferase [Flavobacterium branchiarum]
MAKKITDISNEIYAKIAADSTLPNSISQSAIYRRFIFIISYAIWLLDSLFDTHKAEVTDIIEQQFPHRPSWYRTKAKAFQYGFDLIEDTDKYDNVGFPEEQIENSKIIKYSAVTQSAGQLLIKIATESDGVLSPISTPQKASFDAYMSEITDCGVKYIVVNHLPDILLLNLQIFRDSLVIDNTGMSILYGNFPVQDAILEYMKELPFNGELVLFDLETKLKNIEGVRIPNIVNAESQIIDISTGEYLPPKAINVKTIPESGYFVVPNFDNVKYVV